MEKVKEWLLDNSSGDGFGFGNGSGDGFADGFGFGFADVFTDSCTNGSGMGSRFDSGYGNGNGSGDGFADGSGFGNGSGNGVDSFEGKPVHLIDGVQTIIEHIKGSFAKGFLLNSDFTLTPCYVVKGNGYFAHGKTIKDAMKSLRKKIFENMNREKSIEAFLDMFKKGERYPGMDFFEWHYYLTGSCLMGREAFVKNNELNLDAMYTVDEFIAVCENDYGSDVIKQLKERWTNM